LICVIWYSIVITKNLNIIMVVSFLIALQDISCFIAENRIALASLFVSIYALYFAHQTHKRKSAGIIFALSDFYSFHIDKNIRPHQQSYVCLYLTIINDSQFPVDLTGITISEYSPIHRFLKNLRVRGFEIIPYRLLRRKSESLQKYLNDYENKFPHEDESVLVDDSPIIDMSAKVKKRRLDSFELVSGYICFHSAKPHKSKKIKLYLEIHTSRKFYKHKITVNYFIPLS